MFPKKTKKDDVVIKQGDIGDALFIVDVGSFDFLIQADPKSAPKKVGTAKPGDIFGELALMYNAPRAATVKCSSKTGFLWALNRKSFQTQVISSAASKTAQYDEWLTKVELLKPLTPMELNVVSQLLKREEFSEGDLIIKEGDEGDRFYIMAKGEARAYVKGKEVKKYEKQGDYFGEIALLTNAKRQASVLCVSDVQVVYLLKRDFDKVIGPAKEMLMKKIGEYN